MKGLKREWLFLLMLPFFLALAYSNSLHNGWHFDDIPTILENEHIRSLNNVPSFFLDPSTFSGREGSKAMYRPLLLVGYAMTYRLGAYELPLWHVTQLLLHLFCGLLVFVWVRQLLSCHKAALFSSLLFLLHPIQSQPVNYLSSRSEIQVSLFYLLSLICWTHFRTKDSRKGWYFLSLTAMALGLLTKSVAVTIPVAITLWEWWLCPLHEKTSERCKKLAPFYVLLFLFLLLRFFVVGAILFPGEGQKAQLISLVKDGEMPQAVHYIGGRSFITNLKMQGVALWAYLRLLLWPRGLSIIHYISPECSWLSLSFAVIALLILFCLRKKAPLFSFGGLFFLILLSPTSLVPLNLAMNEHRVYLALLGILLPLAHFLFSQKRVVPLYLALPLILLCTHTTRERNQYWRSSVALFGGAVKVAPKSRFVHYEYGYALLKEGFIEEGVKELEKEGELFPNQKAAFWASLGSLNLKLGKKERARKCLKKAQAKDENCPVTKQLAQRLNQ